MFKNIAKKLGYLLFTCLSLLYFVYSDFPLDIFKSKLLNHIKAPFNIDFKQAKTYWLSGVSLEDVSITFNPQSEIPNVAHFDKINARLSLLPLLLGHQKITFSIYLQDTILEGSFEQKKEGMEINLDSTEFNLSRLFMQKLVQQPLQTALQIKAHLTLQQDPKKSTGKINITLKKLNNADTSIMGMTVPSIDLGQLSLEAEIQDGQVHIRKYEQAGTDAESRLSGTIRLATDPAMSQLNLTFQIKPLDNWFQKNPNLRTLMQFPLVQQRRSADGFLSLPIAGTLSYPQIR